MKRHLPIWVAAVLFTSFSVTAQHGAPKQPDDLVRNLYHEVVARNPHDIPKGPDWNIFAPYLSKGLLQKVDLSRACTADRDQQSSESQVTKKILSNYGFFTGGETTPQTFQIEKIEPQKNGSSRVYLNLTAENPPGRPWTWLVAVVVIREKDHFVVDDVLYIDNHIYDREGERRDKQLSTYLSAGCDGARWSGHALPSQPEAFVRSLYAQVMARRPVGIPGGEDWKVFAPYLSKALLDRIDLALACGADWDRQYPDPNLKPEMAWLELGIFSGGDDESELRTFHIERTQSAKDGSLQVHVRLFWGRPGDPWFSRVAVIVVRENGRYVVDDVIYLKEQKQDEWRLITSLSAGCDGPHWVGYQDSK